jgi:predicted nucleic acid-binding protein
MYGNIMSHLKTVSKPLSILDGQIASIARSQRKILATRNVKDFTNCELELINPFE